MLQGLASGFPWGLEWRKGEAEALLVVIEMANEDTLQGPASGCPFAILGSVPALPVKLSMNSITSLFFINHKTSQPLLKCIVYCNAEQDSGT